MDSLTAPSGSSKSYRQPFLWWLWPIHANGEQSVVFAINNAEVLKHHLLPHLLQAGCHASPINCLLAKCIFAHYLVLSFDCMCLILIIIGVAHCHWASHVSCQIRLKIVYWSLDAAHFSYEFNIIETNYAVALKLRKKTYVLWRSVVVPIVLFYSDRRWCASTPSNPCSLSILLVLDSTWTIPWANKSVHSTIRVPAKLVLPGSVLSLRQSTKRNNNHNHEWATWVMEHHLHCILLLAMWRCCFHTCCEMLAHCKGSERSRQYL